MKSNQIVYVFFYPAEHPRHAGQPCYVGKGKKNRLQGHIKGSHNKQLRWLFAKYGDLPCVVLHERLMQQNASEIEIALIKAIGRTDNGTGPLVNHTDGGEGVLGLIHSENTKIRVGFSSKLMWSDPERHAEIVAAQNVGRSTPEYRAKRREISKKIAVEFAADMSIRTRIRYQDPNERQRTRELTSAAMRRPEVRAAVSAAQKKRFEDPVEIERMRQHNIGRKHSIETRAKMSESRQGRIVSDQTRSQLRQSNLDTWNDPVLRNSHAVMLKNYWAEHPRLWITDGVQTKGIKVGDPIPDGWRRGRTIRSRGVPRQLR